MIFTPLRYRRHPVQTLERSPVRARRKEALGVRKERNGRDPRRIRKLRRSHQEHTARYQCLHVVQNGKHAVSGRYCGSVCNRISWSEARALAIGPCSRHLCRDTRTVPRRSPDKSLRQQIARSTALFPPTTTILTAMSTSPRASIASKDSAPASSFDQDEIQLVKNKRPAGNLANI